MPEYRLDAKRMPTRSIAILTFCVCVAFPAAAQDMMRYVDLNSPEMTTAEMTRDEVAAKGYQGFVLSA